jgi:hypothetical protein
MAGHIGPGSWSSFNINSEFLLKAMLELHTTMTPERHSTMKNVLLLLTCCCAGPVLAAEPSALRFQHVVIDAKPPRNPWIKIVGDLNGDGRLDIILALAEPNGGRQQTACVAFDEPFTGDTPRLDLWLNQGVARP